MKNLKNKLKLIEIVQNLKKDLIDYDEAIRQISDIDKKEFICCDNIVIEETKCKYPNGLPLDTIEITYCSNCDRIHDVSW
jgi:hypothetical protein